MLVALKDLLLSYQELAIFGTFLFDLDLLFSLLLLFLKLFQLAFGQPVLVCFIEGFESLSQSTLSIRSVDSPSE